MMKKLIWIIILIAIGVGGYFALFGDKTNMSDKSDKTDETNKSNWTDWSYWSNKFSGGDPNNISSEEINQMLINQNQPKNYSDPELLFSFNYPPEYNLSVVDEGEEKTILIQKEGNGMQLYIAPYSGAEVTTALIKKEIKDVSLKNLTDVNMPRGGRAATFFYKDASLGDVWNVWFSREKHIYQLTAEANHETAIKMFVETFEMN